MTLLSKTLEYKFVTVITLGTTICIVKFAKQLLHVLWLKCIKKWLDSIIYVIKIFKSSRLPLSQMLPILSVPNQLLWFQQSIMKLNSLIHLPSQHWNAMLEFIVLLKNCLKSLSDTNLLVNIEILILFEIQIVYKNFYLKYFKESLK